MRPNPATSSAGVAQDAPATSPAGAAQDPAHSPCSQPHARPAPALTGRDWWALTPPFQPSPRRTAPGGFIFCCGCSHPGISPRAPPLTVSWGGFSQPQGRDGSREVPPRRPAGQRGGDSPASDVILTRRKVGVKMFTATPRCPATPEAPPAPPCRAGCGSGHCGGTCS